ncbi:hypothetical protein B0H66DRAFT_604239 [Apodospora peruviana]|uniref:Uncharacterized protein n=1 Tax=Apodospora peruviana TaxID=516989 RepID=A0AAE0M226_9PEZI|nr:hypothetical protein B0H66DRAFT_604239 [Apodospora peruviana]
MGAISVWNFPRLNLVYRLINDSGLIADMAFSPAGHRVYEIRVSVCNVWEPATLVRADEQDMERQIIVGGTTIVTEPTVSHFDGGGQLVTALALDSKGQYYCCGREDGKLGIHDAVSGKRLRKVYGHWTSSTVIVLAWSESGKYMVSCDDGAFVIAKRLQVKEGGIWGVFPVLDRRLEENVSQFLFSAGEQSLLVSTPTADYVWDLKAKEEMKYQQWPERQSRWWIQHPSQKHVLVWINPSEIRCCKWPALELIGDSLPTSSSECLSASAVMSHRRSPSQHSSHSHAEHVRRVFWAAIAGYEQSIVYATLPDHGSWTMSCLSHSNLHIESIDATHFLTHGVEPSQSARRRCVEGVADQVKHLLGLFKTSIVFLDHDCWVCTWDMQDGSGQVLRHFFIPKDWLNASTAHMTVANSYGALFCLRYGDVAIVRNGIRI